MKRLKVLLGICCVGIGLSVPLSAQTQWFDPMNDSLPAIQGRYWNQEIGCAYQRLPERAKSLVRTTLWDLSRQTAGLFVRFYTSSPSICVQYQVNGPLNMPHMPSTGVSGVDLYATDCNGHSYWCQGTYEFGDTVRYHFSDLTYHNTHNRGNEYTLYLPLYNGVKFLRIGVPEGNDLYFMPPSMEKPIVVYGTSIAQGACASRPGMAWSNILQRKLEMPVINLGFSGNGQLDESFFRLLSEIDASLFVIDCMPNMTGNRVSWIDTRLRKGLRYLRDKSQAPILLVEHDGYMGYQVSDSRGADFQSANRALRKVYEEMKDSIGGLHYLSFEELGLSMDSQVDGVHASDWGMKQYADAYERKVCAVLYPERKGLHFTPMRQHRDLNTYNWAKRHEEVLAYNRQNQPEVVMIGNSITHYWGGYPQAPIREADEVWRKLFKNRIVVNLGYGWDRIENVAWRILHGELDGYEARQIFMMLGTNNLDLQNDDEIVEGILDVVSLVKKKQPKARLYVVKILPRRHREERLVRLNEKLEQALRQEPSVKVLDLSEPLLNAEGHIDEQLFRDGLHPNRKGYQRLAKQLKTYLQEEPVSENLIR